MPTQGSCLPVVLISVEWPFLSILSVGRRILEVGFKAIETKRSCPELIPPSIQPELLEVKPSGGIGSLWSEPF